MKPREHGQTTVFFTLILTGLLLLTAVGVEIGRIVYALGEVGKAADAASLAAASRIDISLYRETGQVIFLPDVYDYAQTYANMNSSYLSSRSVPVTVTGVYIDEASQTVSVSVTANLSALLPAVLNYKRQYTIIGYAKGRLDGR
jgi:Flp pilus assembly protein TadG